VRCVVPEAMASTGPATTARRGRKRRCPVCSRSTEDRYTPFCSLRCADIDLARWFSGAYRVPTEEPAGLSDGGDRGAEEGENG